MFPSRFPTSPDDARSLSSSFLSLQVGAFDSLIEDIADTDQKNRILRSNGLKVEQLKGELEMALKGGHH